MSVTTTLPCVKCTRPFTYEKTGQRPRKYCPTCKTIVMKEQMRATSKRNRQPKVKFPHKEFLREETGESRDEIAAKLAVWEAFEHAKNNKGVLLATRLSRQGIRYIENSALLKLRHALKPEYDALKEALKG